MPCNSVITVDDYDFARLVLMKLKLKDVSLFLNLSIDILINTFQIIFF